jgi:hypothetical protein
MTIEPIPGEPTRWIVQSESRKDYAFIVDLDYSEAGEPGRPACGCEQFMVRGIVCKHILAIQALTARRKLPA